MQVFFIICIAGDMRILAASANKQQYAAYQQNKTEKDYHCFQRQQKSAYGYGAESSQNKTQQLHIAEASAAWISARFSFIMIFRHRITPVIICFAQTDCAKRINYATMKKI